MVVEGSGVSDGGGRVFGVYNRGGMVHRGLVDNRGSGVCDWCGYLGDGSNDLGDVTDMLLVYDSVETVLIISGVLHGALGTIRVYNRVGASHHITVASLVLGLGVAGETVLHVVREGVLRMGVVFFDSSSGGDNLGDWSDYLSDWGGVRYGGSVYDRGGGVCWSGMVSWSRGVRYGCRRDGISSASGSHQAGEDDKL